MSSVLPIDTQRYESGDYTLEVTAHRSPLSQWSDRTVVRQLRFSLWSEQQRLATGNQLQLVTLSDTIESYVQRHLSQQAWPQTHRLKLLDQDVELSTLQLFDLAEVLNSYGQRHITLPKVPAKRRRQWWTGSAVASLLVAVGLTTVYLQYRPAAFNQMETSQAPEAVLEDEGSPAAPDAAPETLSEDDGFAPPLAETTAPPVPNPEASSDNAVIENRSENRSENQLPSSSPALESAGDAESAPAPPPEPAAGATEPSADTFATAQEQLEQDTVPRDAAPAETDIQPEVPPAPVASAPESAEESVANDTGTAESAVADERLESAARIRQPERESDDGGILAAIATQLAPYQPKDAAYPLIYQLQISPDGTILTQTSVSDNAPELDLSDVIITPPPGRALTVEVSYTRSGLPTVREIE